MTHANKFLHFLTQKKDQEEQAALKNKRESIECLIEKNCLSYIYTISPVPMSMQMSTAPVLSISLYFVKSY